jgi:hypothetical protein
MLRKSMITTGTVIAVLLTCTKVRADTAFSGGEYTAILQVKFPVGLESKGDGVGRAELYHLDPTGENVPTSSKVAATLAFSPGRISWGYVHVGAGASTTWSETTTTMGVADVRAGAQAGPFRARAAATLFFPVIIFNAEAAAELVYDGNGFAVAGGGNMRFFRGPDYYLGVNVIELMWGYHVSLEAKPETAKSWTVRPKVELRHIFYFPPPAYGVEIAHFLSLNAIVPFDLSPVPDGIEHH